MLKSYVVHILRYPVTLTDDCTCSAGTYTKVGRDKYGPWYKVEMQICEAFHIFAHF